MATAAGFLSTLRKKLFRKGVAEPEVPLDLQKVETMLDATAARLSALESSLFDFKSDIQYRQQLNMLRVAWLAAAHAAARRSRGPPALCGAALWTREALAAWVPKRGCFMACAPVFAH